VNLMHECFDTLDVSYLHHFFISLQPLRTNVLGDWGKPTIPASAQLAAELPHAVSILIIAPWFVQ